MSLHVASSYDVLGIKPSASVSEIQASYRKLAAKHHPDHVHGTDAQKREAEEKFKQISEAYSVLKDPVKRKAHDQQLFQQNANAKIKSVSLLSYAIIVPALVLVSVVWCTAKALHFMICIVPNAFSKAKAS